MSLPNSFGNEPNPVMSELDVNFAALGAISYVPCTAAGTNTITLTPRANTPAINGYSQLQGYPFVAVGTNTGGVQIQVLGPSGSPLTLLQAYKLSSAGPIALTAGDIQNGSYYVPVYDLALNSGVGGFHLVNVVGTITSLAQPNTVYAGPTSASPTAPTFRRLIGADLPNPATTTLGGVLTLQSQVSQFVTSIGTSGQPVTAQVFFSDLGGSVAGIKLPLPTLTTLGGVLALNSSPSQFVNAIASSGQPQTVQVFFSNLAGAAIGGQIPAPTTTTLGGVFALNSAAGQVVVAIAGSGQAQTTSTLSGLSLFGTNLTGGGFTNGLIVAASLSGVQTGNYTLAGTPLLGNNVAISAISGSPSIGVSGTGLSGIFFGPSTVPFNIYDSGSWLPVIVGNSVSGNNTYARQAGRWTRIGARVFCDFDVQLSAKDSTMAGFVTIGNLPFATSSSVTACGGGFAIIANITFGSSGTYSQLCLQAGGTTPIRRLVIQKAGSGVGNAIVDPTDLAGVGVRINGSVNYDVDGTQTTV